MKTFRRLALTLAMLVMAAGVANAEFRFGIKAGINVDKMHLSEDVFDANNQCGFTGGVMTEFEVPLIGLCFDLSAMYTRMNSRITYDNSTAILNASDATGVENDKGKNFLEIPLNIKYKFQIPVVASVIKPYLFTGPSFAVKLDKNTLDSFKTKTCQVAWNVGVGVELVKHLQISGSYAFGVNNIAKNWVNAQDIKVKNNYWTITAAYLF